MTHDTDVFFDDADDRHLVDAMDERRRQRARLMAEVNSRYFATARDTELEREVQTLVEGAAVTANGFETERRALFVIGETGAGKTRAVDRVIDAMEEFRPVETPTTVTCPIVRIVAPKPCTLKMLGAEILRGLGYPLIRDIREGVLWGMVRHQLKERRVRFIQIDEGQHMLNWRNEAEMEKLSDTLKNVMQQRDWPVRLIVGGLPELADFLQRDGQLRRRSHVVHLKNLKFPRDAKLLGWLAATIVRDHAGMEFGFEVSDEFLARLCRASWNQFGIVTQIVRGAVEQALLEDRPQTEVTARHFARSYAAFSGCQPSENIMTAANWTEIVPQNALQRDAEDGTENEPAPRPRRGRPRKKGGSR